MISIYNFNEGTHTEFECTDEELEEAKWVVGWQTGKPESLNSFKYDSTIRNKRLGGFYSNNYLLLRNYIEKKRYTKKLEERLNESF